MIYNFMLFGSKKIIIRNNKRMNKIEMTKIIRISKLKC